MSNSVAPEQDVLTRLLKSSEGFSYTRSEVVDLHEDDLNCYICELTNPLYVTRTIVVMRRGRQLLGMTSLDDQEYDDVVSCQQRLALQHLADNRPALVH